MAYLVELPEELSPIHKTFHVSQLQKCVANESAVISLDDIQVDGSQIYFERPVAILGRKTKGLQHKEVKLI